MTHPWLGMGLVIAIFGGLMAALGAYRRWGSPDPELLRKLLHMGMGLVTLTFPWLFVSTWPVLFLAVGFTLALAELKRSRSLQRRFGDVIHGVGRESLGEFYFPLSVGVLFVLAGSDPLLFCLPVLILTLADAAAALVGGRYGRTRYATLEGRKSVEGSLACFGVACLSTDLVLRLWAGTGGTESLLVALVIGLQVTLLEAIAWRGLDNLFIPIGAFLLLKTLLTLDMAWLLAHLGVTLAMVMLLGLSAYRRTVPGRGSSTSQWMAPGH